MRLLAAARDVTVTCLLAATVAPAFGQQPASAPSPVRAADSTRRVNTDTALEELTRKVSAELRCPVCQGLSLADSPSELALEMKDVVRSQLAAGRTPGEVKSYFVQKYGEWILLEPEPKGVNWLVYLLPAGAVLAGLAVLWVVLRRWTSGVETGDDALVEPMD